MNIFLLLVNTSEELSASAGHEVALSDDGEVLVVLSFIVSGFPFL